MAGKTPTVCDVHLEHGTSHFYGNESGVHSKVEAFCPGIMVVQWHLPQAQHLSLLFDEVARSRSVTFRVPYGLSSSLIVQKLIHLQQHGAWLPEVTLTVIAESVVDSVGLKKCSILSVVPFGGLAFAIRVRADEAVPRHLSKSGGGRCPNWMCGNGNHNETLVRLAPRKSRKGRSDMRTLPPW